MSKKISKKRLLSLFMAVAVLLSVFSTSLMAVSAAGTAEMTNLSISGEIGYYVKDGVLYQYDVNEGSSAVVDGMSDLNADYVLFDGSTLYTAGTNTVVSAYNTGDWQLKWKYDKQDEFDFQPPYSETVYCQPNAQMVIQNGQLYIYTYAAGGTFIPQAKAAVLILDAETGEAKAPISLITAYNSNDNMQSIAYELDGKIVFTGSTYTTVDLESGDVTCNSPVFEGAAAYESASDMLVGLSGGTLGYTSYPLTSSSKTTDMGLKPAGEMPALKVVDGVAVIFSVKDGKVIYDIFTGLDLVSKQTEISTGSILNISILGTNAYIALDNGNIEKLTVDFSGVPTHVGQSSAAKELDKRIQDILSKLPTFNGTPDISRMSLEYEEEINSINTAYNGMDEEEKKGVFNRSWLTQLKQKTDELRANLDAINNEVAELPEVDALVKEDAPKVKAVKTKYDALKDFDKTLVSEKFFKLLEKVAAYDVIDMIDELPALDALSTEDLISVQAARKAYNAVVDAWKGEVTNIDILTKAEEKLAQLMEDMGEGAYWPSYAKDYYNNAVVDSKLPTSLDEMEIILDGQEEKLSVKDPIIVGERMYVVSGKQLVCYDLNGKKIAATDLYSGVGFFSRIAYGDGKIFVSLSDRVQAFDAKTLNSLWLTPSTGGQTINTITYNDGYIYTGYTMGDGGMGKVTEGAYFCISTKDENKEDGYEVKDYVWKDASSGYYWAGGVVVGDRIYYAGDKGKLYCHHLTRDIIYDTFDVGGRVRSNLMYDHKTQRLMVVTADNAVLYAIELNSDGTFNKDNIIKTESGMISGTTGGISCYNGRIYVPSGGMLGSGPLSVLEMDEASGKFIKAYDIGDIRTQSTPLICTAYATKENNYKVYVYAIDYTSGIAYAFEDCQGQTEYKEAFKLSNQETIGGVEHKTTTYNSASFKADQYGNLYFIGGSSWSFPSGGSATTYALTVFKNKNAEFSTSDIENAIELLPGEVAYEDKAEVLSIKSRYDALDAEDQKLISNSAKLFKAVSDIEKLTQEKIAEVEQKIEDISDPVSLADEKTIEEASRLYGLLTEDDKSMVTNIVKLREASDALHELKASVEGLIEKIDGLPEIEQITLEHSALVNELWANYEAFSESDQLKVTNIDKLIAAKDKIKELNDKTLVSEIVKQIDALPSVKDVTLAHEKAVNDLHFTFNGLHDAAKALVTNADKLEELYNAVISYRKSVDEIDAQIWNELDPLNITLEDKQTIEQIEAKYEALREEEKAYVKYFSDVEDAKQIIASLEKGIVPKQVFENIMGMDIDYSVQSEGVTITFNGMDITAPADFKYAVSVNIAAEEGEKTPFKDGILLSFTEQGQFPGKASIELTTELADGEYYLYAYDKEDNSAVKMQTINLKDGKVIITVESGGTYAIAKGLQAAQEGNDPNKEEQPPKTGDGLGIPFAAAVMVFVIAGALLAIAIKKSAFSKGKGR